MNDRIRMQRLKLALRVISVFFVVGFLGFYVLVLLDSSLVARGSLVGALLRWSPYHKAYEGMIVAIYAVWGVFLWRASHSPVENGSLIDFTIWANLAHAVEMLVAAFVLEGESIHLMGDVLVVGLVAGVLYWLRPVSVAPPEQSRAA